MKHSIDSHVRTIAFLERKVSKIHGMKGFFTINIKFVYFILMCGSSISKFF